MARRALAVVAALWCSALLAGCAANVAVVFDFPTADAFRASEQVLLDVVRIAPGALGSCPDVTERSLRGDTLDLAIALEPTSVCDAEAGIALGDPGGGPFAFVAQVLDNRSTAILVGCTVAEAYPGAPPVRIELYPTMAYNPSVARSDVAMRAGSTCAGGP